MRALSLIAVILAAFALSSPGAAQTPPNVLLPGSISPNVARGTNIWCAVDPGPSSFQRNGNAAAKISFPDVTYVDHSSAPLSYLLNGLANLTFSGATAGTISFIVTGGAPSTIARASFSNYTQTYNASTRALTVSFKIAFPSCNLTIRGYYRGS